MVTLLAATSVIAVVLRPMKHLSSFVIFILIGCSSEKSLPEPAPERAVQPMPEIELQHSTGDYIPNPHPNGETPFEEFWDVRSSILTAVNEHGKTGPESNADGVDFWLVEDQLNDERYHRMEVYSSAAFSVDMIKSLATALRDHVGWGISIGGYDNGNLVLFADRLVLIGNLFEGCGSLGDVATSLRNGVETFRQRKDGSLEGQIKLIKHRLSDAMPDARAEGFAYLATFDHYQLHAYNAVWILQTENNDDVYMETDHGAIHPRAVDADGTIHEPFCRDFWPYTDLAPDFWLVVYLNGQQNLTEFRYVDEEQTEVAVVETSAAIGTSELAAILAGLP